MAATAQIVQFLLSPLAASGITLSGGQAFFFAAGTSTPKDIWIDRSKTTLAANPYTLDSNGTAQLYADGTYRVVIKDSNGVTRYDRDYISFTDNASDLASITSRLIKNVSEYADDLAAAVTAIGNTPTTLAYASDLNVSTNLTIPDSLELFPLNGAVINHGVYNINYEGSTSRWPVSQMFNGTGTVTLAEPARPEWLGTGSQAVQRAFVASSSVILQDGKEYDITGGVTVTAPYKTLKGKGIVKGGSITFGAESGSPVDMHFEVNGPTFQYDALASNQSGLVLRRARYGRIQNCRFVNTDKAIEIASVDAIQHVNRLQIAGNDFDNVNYCVYSAGKQTTNKLTVGDLDFSNNHFCYARITHLYLTGQDGLTCNNNTFYFIGYPAKDATKAYNLYADYVANWTVTGNNFFEAGLDGVWINDGRRVVLSNNNIVWPGQRVPSCGIRLTNTTLYGVEHNDIIVTGNNISFATLHGIYASEHNKLHVADNTTTSTGTYFTSGVYTSYYGTSPAPASLWASTTHYSVNLGETVNGHVNARTTFTDNNLVDLSGAMPNYPSDEAAYRNYYRGNMTPTGTVRQSRRYLTQSANDTVLAGAGYDVINLSQTAPTTVTGISGGEDGAILQLAAFNGNTTLDDQAVGETTNRLVLKGSTNVTLINGCIITLQYFTDRWKEIARNF